ncbi:MAG TPA: cytochrome C oxidase subunit IV family protein [Anaeromyxobacteraceae bacterium]
MAIETGVSVRTNRREYLFVFLALAALTALELTVIRFPGIGRSSTIAALVVLAISKATLIGLFFMHLRYETRILKLTVLIPLLAPAGYALALIADATWRLMR